MRIKESQCFIEILTADPEKDGFPIGLGGRNIRFIEAESGAEQGQVRPQQQPAWAFC